MIIILTDAELSETGKRTALEHLGTEDVITRFQGMILRADMVIVARKIEGQKYYSLFPIKRGRAALKSPLSGREPTPLINLSTLVAGELP
jgi:hypothetical protein